jgi:hypothetical protein
MSRRQQLLARLLIAYREIADSEALRTGFRRKADSVPMIADSR